MSLGDFLRKQLIDVIQWTEDSDGVLAYRYPMRDMEIQYGARLTVRESQLALFVNEGKIADQFAPGLYTLETQTLPLLTNLKHWYTGFESPFKSDGYFFSTRTQTDQRGGTSVRASSHSARAVARSPASVEDEARAARSSRRSR